VKSDNNAVALEPHEMLRRTRKRDGRCYALANKIMLEPGADQFTLVHGIVRGPRDTRIDHAWVMLPDGRLYDPVENAYFSTAGEYAERYKAVIVRMFTRLDACEAMLVANHHGPWHDVVLTQGKSRST